MTKFDVIVAGGGSAGIASAVSAAKIGAHTLLVERNEMLGGMGTSALVHTICGLFAFREDKQHIWANNGFARTFATRLLDTGGAQPPRHMGRMVVMPHNPVAFASLADAMMEETPHLEVWMGAEIVAAHPQLEEVDIICRGVRNTVSASTYVDATGDATLTMLAGGDFSMSESKSLQRPAYIVGMCGFPTSFFEDDHKLQLAYRLVAAVNAGHLPREVLGAGFRQGLVSDEAFLTLDLAAEKSDSTWDPTSARCLADVVSQGRRVATMMTHYLRKNMEGCENCRITHWPSRAGIRESRRACGFHELTKQEILNGVSFDDAIANIGWPLELREKATGAQWHFPESDSPAQIPLRCLRHRDIRKLWIAGRCISCTHEAQASIRVMGTCMATGEAAGLAAAIDDGRGENDWKRVASNIKQHREKIWSHP